MKKFMKVTKHNLLACVSGNRSRRPFKFCAKITGPTTIKDIVDKWLDQEEKWRGYEKLDKKENIG